MLLSSDLGFSPQKSAEFEWVGALHDAGKLVISDEMLRKTGKLSLGEYETIKTHPVHSEKLSGPLAHLMNCEWAPAAVRHHHERIDGAGYPDGLAGDLIPVEARVIAICDAYDAMAGCRPYQGSLAETTIREKMTDAAGSHLDRQMTGVFLSNLTQYREKIYDKF